jgi:hypothetical protein
MRKFILLLLFFLVVSCEKETTKTVELLQVIEVIPKNGGGTIVYSLPQDNDVLYVNASYLNSRGQEVQRISSKFNNRIEVDGFIGNESVEVALRVYDEDDNASDPVMVDFVPLTSFVFVVLESMTITPDLGGVKLNWNNPSGKTVFVYVDIAKEDGETETRILSSKKKDESIFIRGLEAVQLTFSVRVEDIEGNTTSLEEVGTYTPLFEQKIDKNSWTLVGNLSVNGNAWEGSTTNFWDDIIDTAATNNDNSYFIIWRDQNGGSLQWPLDIVVDMNKKARINRFVVWQRAYWYGGVVGVPYYFQEENLRSFDFYVSNDKVDWNLVGSFDIGDPKVGGSAPTDVLEDAANGHEFNLEAVTETFRYFKFSITSNYGSDTYVHGSEISLFGIDNQ